MVRALRVAPRERAHAVPQQPQREPPVGLEYGEEARGIHLGVAIHVASGPRAEEHRRDHDRGIAAQTSCHLGAQRRHGVEEHRLEEEQHVLYLVLHPRARPPYRVGLPPEGEGLAYLSPRLLALGGAEAIILRDLERRGDLALVIEDGAPPGLGGVRGEHELDLERRRQRRDALRILVAQGGGGLGERLALAAGVAVVAAPLAHALARLGDVGERELHGAGADEGGHLRVGGLAQPRDQPLSGLLVAGADGGCVRVQGAHRFPQLRTLQALHHLAEQLGEQLGLPIERVVGRGWSDPLDLGQRVRPIPLSTASTR